MATESPGQLPGLTPGERELLKKVFSSPLDIPIEFKSWLVSWLGTNPPEFLLSQMVGADKLPRIVNGIVGPTGSIISGSGYGVSKGGTGAYTVTFDTAFPSAPAVLLTAVNGACVASLVVMSASAFTVSIVDAGNVVSGAAQPRDSEFTFLASQTL